MNTPNYLKSVVSLLVLAVSIVVLPITGGILYKRNCRAVQHFCFLMCNHKALRNYFALFFALDIATVIAVSLWCYEGGVAAAALTIVVSMSLAFDKLWQSVLGTLRQSRQIQFVIMVMALTATITPHLLPFGAGLYLLLVAVIFYPSREVLDKMQTYDGLFYYRNHLEELVTDYFK